MAWLLYARPIPVSDFESYRALAQHILDQGSLPASAYRLPGHPYFLAIMMMVSRSVFWLSFSMVILSTALVGLVYRLVHRLTDGDTGKAACCATICGVNPTFVVFGSILGSEHLGVLLLFAALLLLLESRPVSNFQSRWIVAGGLLGLSVLTRGEAVFYLPSLLLACFLVIPHRKDKVIASLCVLAACALVVIPWHCRNRIVVGPGSGLSTTGGINFYFAHNSKGYGWQPLEETDLAGLSEIAAHERGYAMGLDYIKRRGLSGFCKDVLLGTRSLYSYSSYAVSWSTKLPRDRAGSSYPSRDVPGAWLLSSLGHMFYIYLGVLATLCVFFWRRAGPLSRWLPLLSILALNWFCYAVVFWSKGRYRFTGEVIMCILAGITLNGLLSSIRGSAPGEIGQVSNNRIESDK